MMPGNGVTAGQLGYKGPPIHALSLTHMRAVFPLYYLGMHEF